MSRAERRRNDRNKKKSVKTYNMTAESLASLREAEYQKARKDIMGKVDDVYRQIFVMMLAIPTNILISDYWKKSSKQRIPKFVDECLNLYEAWMSGAVDVGGYGRYGRRICWNQVGRLSFRYMGCFI